MNLEYFLVNIVGLEHLFLAFLLLAFASMLGFTWWIALTRIQVKEVETTGKQSQRDQPKNISACAQVSLLLGSILIFSFYAISRYAGWWGETDTGSNAEFLYSMFTEGQLITKVAVYPNGYGYPVLGVFLSHIAGIDIPDLQIFASALMAFWIVLPAWLLYREFLGSTKGATLATVILLIQPEFLFPILRGTHEKFTRGLMFLCLYLLLRSLRSQGNLRVFASIIIVFYLCAYSLITFNNLLATSFIIALLLALLLSWLARLRNLPSTNKLNPTYNRLFYIILTLLAVSFVFTFYAYPPARDQIQVLNGVWKKLAIFLFQLEWFNPYSIVSETWISLPVYFIVSLANWILLLVSLIIWVSKSVDLFIHRRPFESQRELLLWAFYGGFALQGGLSIAVDFSGAIAANLQHRIFPSFAMVAAPILVDWLLKLRPLRTWIRYPLVAGLSLIISLFAVLSTFKATNEPLLSNKWLLYLPAEMQAVKWADQYLSGRSLWTEYDERIIAAVSSGNDLSKFKVNFDQFLIEPITQDFLISTTTRLHSLRLGKPLPVVDYITTIYNNGEAQIIHLPPRPLRLR